MKTQQLNLKWYPLALVMAILMLNSPALMAQEVEDVQAEQVDTDATDTAEVKKVITGKRIKVVIATRTNGELATEEMIIDLPDSITAKDAEAIEKALEKAGKLLEESIGESASDLEEALRDIEIEHNTNVEELAELMEDAERTVEIALEEVEGDLEEAERELKRTERLIKQHRVVITDDGMSDPTTVTIYRKDSKPKLVETSWNVMELGINELLTPNGADLPAQYADMNIIPAKSVNFHWGIVQQGINLAKGKLRLVYGLGIDFNNYRFKEDIDLTEGSKPLEYEVNENINYRKNKLVTQYLTMPLMLNFKSNPRNENRSLNIAAGVHGGYLIQSHQKQKWQEDGSKEKRKIKGDYNINPYRLGYAIQFGYGDVNIYARYYPDPVFRDGKGPEVNTAAVGIVLMPF